MPFALNEATRSISPTKTLEYMAAGLPVGFAVACRRVLDECPDARAAKAEPTLHWNHWDTIAGRMEDLMAGAGSRSGAATA
jgi:hypothetical protein